MLNLSNEYAVYLYSGKVDMRKGIDGLCGVVRSGIGISPFRSKCIFVFWGRNPRAKKVLIREYNRFERQIDPDREKFMREMYEKEVRRTEDYYKKMLEDMSREYMHLPGKIPV